MRARITICVGFALALPCGAQAGDLSNALQIAQSVMGEDAVEGLEHLIKDHPNEALSILLHRDGEAYFPSPERQRRTRRAPFADLGKTRLSYNQLSAPIQAAADATGLPVALIDAVIRTESGYRPHAVSRVGAQGLMQLMPATAREVGVRNAFDPADNIMGGARYLRKMYDRFQSVELAVAAYNAGPHRVKKYKGIPPFKETKAYVKTVMRRYQERANRQVR